MALEDSEEESLCPKKIGEQIQTPAVKYVATIPTQQVASFSNFRHFPPVPQREAPISPSPLCAKGQYQTRYLLDGITLLWPGVYPADQIILLPGEHWSVLILVPT